MATNRTTRIGFTTIEVLATSVLASLLMIATLGVIAGIAKKEKILEQENVAPPWHTQLTRQLTVDFRSAHSIVENGEQLLLAVYGGDTSSASPTDWLPAKVCYYPVSQDDRSLLLRHRLAEVATGESSQSECVAIDAVRLNLYPDLHDVQTNLEQNDLGLGLLTDGPLPSRFRAVVWGKSVDKQSVVLYNQRFRL